MLCKKNMAHLIIGLVCAVGLVWTANSHAAQSVIKIAGSSTIRSIINESSVPFGEKHNVTFSIEGGGSSHGVETAATGKVDIGTASRYLKDTEKKKWPDIVAHLVGQDGVAVILNAALGITALTKTQIQYLYTGKIRNWKEIGGPDEPVILISKEIGRSTLDLFIEYADLEIEENKIMLRMHHRVKGEEHFSMVDARIIGSNQSAIIQVARQKGAIGYVSIGDALIFAERTKRIILPKLDGIEASKANVRNATFPITRPLHLVTNGQPTGIVKEYIDYVMSPEGQKHVAASNFIPAH
jgi:phosphate transport system substrate-binding protein